MVLEKLSVVNYKNIEQADLSFSPKINCFLGNNGMGKTNFLDAIYYLSFCKSAASVLDAQIIRHDQNFFMLQASYISDNEEVEKIHIGGKLGQKKIVKRGEKAYKRMSEHIGLIPLVMISPADVSLVTGSGEERRKFLDLVISQYDAKYLQALTKYAKALQQRNALLKSEAEPDWSIVQIYEQILAVNAKVIYEARQHFVENITLRFNQIYQTISSSSDERVSLTYVSQCSESDLLQKYEEGRAKERIVGYTLYGVHRDDIEMQLNGFAVRREGSQGQNKTFALALKFAQFEYLKEQEHKTPILLLDDVFDKLDALRVERIMDLVSSDIFGQIFVTDTNRDHLDRILQRGHSDYRIINIVGGEAKYA